VEGVAGVVQHTVDELAVRPEAQVVEVDNPMAVDPEFALVSVRTAAAGLVVAAVGGEFLVQEAGFVDPHPDVRAVGRALPRARNRRR